MDITTCHLNPALTRRESEWPTCWPPSTTRQARTVKEVQHMHMLNSTCMYAEHNATTPLFHIIHIISIPTKPSDYMTLRTLHNHIDYPRFIILHCTVLRPPTLMTGVRVSSSKLMSSLLFLASTSPSPPAVAEAEAEAAASNASSSTCQSQSVTSMQ